MIIHNVIQGSPEWFRARLGMPTASRFDKLITPKTMKPSKQIDTFLYYLLAEWVVGESMETENTEYMERGKEIEPDAALWYEFEKECDTREIGFVTSDDGRYGCSPDRFAGDDGGVEIKCPKPSTHLRYLLNDSLLETEYRCQIQGCLWICEREWWDIVCYSPSLYMVNICKRIYRDEEFIEALSGAVKNACNRLEELKERALKAGCVHKELRAGGGENDGNGGGGEKQSKGATQAPDDTPPPPPDEPTQEPVALTAQEKSAIVRGWAKFEIDLEGLEQFGGPSADWTDETRSYFREAWELADKNQAEPMDALLHAFGAKQEGLF